MVHVEDRYVNDDGSINEAGAKADKYGYAIISIMFQVNDTITEVLLSKLYFQMVFV